MNSKDMTVYCGKDKCEFKTEVGLWYVFNVPLILTCGNLTIIQKLNGIIISNMEKNYLTVDQQ